MIKSLTADSLEGLLKTSQHANSSIGNRFNAISMNPYIPRSLNSHLYLERIKFNEINSTGNSVNSFLNVFTCTVPCLSIRKVPSLHYHKFQIACYSLRNFLLIKNRSLIVLYL